MTLVQFMNKHNFKVFMTMNNFILNATYKNVSSTHSRERKHPKGYDETWEYFLMPVIFVISLKTDYWCDGAITFTYKWF